MLFADFHVGQVIHAGPLRVTEPEIIAFAKQFDPQWFHTDPERAAQGRWQGLIASGWHSCALAMRMACDAILIGSESFASPGIDSLRWQHPVRPGDELRLRCEVTEVRRSRGGSGVVVWRWHLRNQNDIAVLEMDATSLFDLSAAASGGRAHG